MDGLTNTKLRAAVYQPPIAKDKMAERNVNDNPLRVLNEITGVLQLASKCAIDVVQFPELFLSGGLFSDVVSGKSAPLDRESYTLNIVGNLCADLSVACCMGYAESRHESEGQTQFPGCYSSIAFFHADGSRAGNYRCLHPPSQWAKKEGDNQIVFEKGHPLVEAIPISLLLPMQPESPTLQQSIKVQQVESSTTTAEAKTKTPREVKVGAMCGGDLSVPEHARYLGRSGAEILVVSGSLIYDSGSRVAKHVIPARSMENELPLLFSNYVDEESASSQSFFGQSAILSADGSELVRAPESSGGDMPSDGGYFLPCEMGGALYAADLTIPANNGKKAMGSIDASMKQWEITPRVDQLGGDKKRDTKVINGRNEKGFRKQQHRGKSKGFGREVMEVLEESKKKKLRLKK